MFGRRKGCLPGHLGNFDLLGGDIEYQAIGPPRNLEARSRGSAGIVGLESPAQLVHVDPDERVLRDVKAGGLAENIDRDFYFFRSIPLQGPLGQRVEQAALSAAPKTSA